MKFEIQEISSDDHTMNMTWHLVKAQKCFLHDDKEQSSSAIKDYSSNKDK